ncbi:hypothetical protein BH11MYX3_BH11MYX3_25450 [soil metagenome]
MSVQPQAIYDLPRGATLGKYEVLRKIATGGMAEIYLARSRGAAGFEKLVVIKRILPNVAEDPTFVQMFLDEARLAATLQHPNIADVYDVGEAAGTPFFAMEYVHGQDVRNIRLTARKRNESVPLSIALAIIHGTASALDYAHEKRGNDGTSIGLVHRDVSASNVIVSYDGAIKLLDFGIARASSRTHKTQVGTLKGKIPYMSPEQCRGFELDRRSDLFSLGVVAFELTVGRRPFRGDSDFEVMDQIVHHGAPLPSSLMRDYPPQLEAIVMKLLAMKQQDRYQTAEALLQDLDPFLHQHRLWVSPKPLGKYMRTIFEDRITAWESAQLEGASLAQYVAESITSPSQRSELVTPPSAFPGLLPLSQEMPAVVQPFADPQAESRPTIYPQLRPSRGKTLFVLAALLAVAIGGIAGFVVYRGNKEPAKTSEPTDTTPAKPAVVTPAPETPVAKPPVAKSLEPVVEVVKPPDPVVAKPPEPAIVTPVARPVAKPPVKPVAKPPVKPPVKPAIKPKKPDKPKDSTWDPNSPFLPPSS